MINHNWPSYFVTSSYKLLRLSVTHLYTLCTILGSAAVGVKLTKWIKASPAEDPAELTVYNTPLFVTHRLHQSGTNTSRPTDSPFIFPSAPQPATRPVSFLRFTFTLLVRRSHVDLSSTMINCRRASTTVGHAAWCPSVTVGRPTMTRPPLSRRTCQLQVPVRLGWRSFFPSSQLQQRRPAVDVVNRVVARAPAWERSEGRDGGGNWWTNECGKCR